MITLGILSGGKSSRYGTDKALAVYREKTFIDGIVDEFSPFMEEIILSAPQSKYDVDLKTVPDRCPGRGPMEGIKEILKSSKTDFVMILAVDMPLVDMEVLYRLVKEYEEGADVVYFTRNGFPEPLCALYRRSILPLIEESVLKNRLKMTKFLTELNGKAVAVDDDPIKYKLANINTVADKNLLDKKIFAVCGVKNSGKTTFIRKVLRELTSRGYRVSVLKHDGHDFKIDDVGKDTGYFRREGASETGILSPVKFQYTKYRTDIKSAVRHFTEYDFLILEGFKFSDFPKFEIVRQGISEKPVAENNVLGIITDIEKRFHKTQFHPNDIIEFCDFITERE